MCKINPRVDYAFKKLFGTEENKDLLIGFINAVVSEQDQVVDLELKNPYNPKNFKNDKISIFDIKAQDKKGTWFNIEMQMLDQEYYAQRAMYYWARLYVSQLSSGINYDKLTKTIGINILNFDCLDEEKYHNVYKLKNIETEKEIINHLEIHFIELEKYDNKLSTLMDRWVNFLKKADEYSKSKLPKELEEVPTIKKALEALETMYLTEEERELYEGRLKWIRDEQIAIASAEKRGREEGMKEGVEKRNIEIAKNMLESGMEIDLVAKITGVSIEEIKKIIENVK